MQFTLISEQHPVRSTYPRKLLRPVFIVMANVVVDILYSVIDPRVRLQ